jgi:hypothetical protein
MDNKMKKVERTWTEEIVVAGGDLVERVKKLVQQGNVRRLIIKKPGGDVLMEIPLTAGAVVGGTLVIMTPILAALGALAALLAEVRVEVVHSEASEED